jgi:S1-C subfamily serine protease/thiol-disulfide isomerase/thioredoxin
MSSVSTRPRVIVMALAGAAAVVAVGGAVFWAMTADLFHTPPPAGQPASRQQGPAKASDHVWLQDFEAAKEQAARERKDILLSFEGSDWCIWCQRMEREILATPEFLDKASADFVLVKVDFPRDEPARSQVRDPAANEKLQRQFRVGAFPAVILTDGRGDMYGGINGFVDGGPGPALAGLDNLRQVRVERDKLLAEVDKQEGAAKLPAAKQALQFLMQRNLAPALKRHVPAWLELARRFDPKNEDGYVETFFEFDWYYRFEAAPAAQLPALFDEVAQWRKQYGDFKDKERAAFIWMELAKGKVELEDFQGAFACLDEGLKLEPTDPRTRQQLQNGPLALGLGTGTAFAVSSAGHFLTNAHVAAGPGKVFVQLSGQKHILPAKLLAERLDLDLALLKVELPKDAKIAPLSLAADHVPRRGEEVAAWGYPLGTTFGHGLKLTKGVISALPEPGTRNLLLLDLRINPGNSGSPLCDAKGNVIGIVSARSQFPVAAESYGMALPGKAIQQFLAGLEIKTPTPEGPAPMTWEEVDRRVSPAVAMVIKARPMPKKPTPAAP